MDPILLDRPCLLLLAARQGGSGVCVEKQVRVDKSTEGLNESRVELRGSAALKLARGLLVAERGSPGPRLGHRDERVTHRDQPRAEWDLVLHEPVGVTGAVPPLVGRSD